jgi:hypothetical protein
MIDPYGNESVQRMVDILKEFQIRHIEFETDVCSKQRKVKIHFNLFSIASEDSEFISALAIAANYKTGKWIVGGLPKVTL